MRRTATRFVWAAVAAIAGGPAGSGADLAAQTETVRLEGSRVAVWNLAGRVEVVPGSGPDVVVRVARGGADAERLSLATGDVDGRASLRVIYPEDRVVYDRAGRGSFNTSVEVRDDGTFGEGRNGRRVRVSGSGRGLEAWADLRIEVPEGRELAVWLAVGPVSADGVTGDLILDTGSGEVDVTNVRGTVFVDTGSGTVAVRQVEGPLSVDTGSGSIRVEDVRADGVRLDTGSGSVTGGGIVASSVRVDTGSGGIRLAGVESPSVRVDTGSGSVELDLLGDVERLDVDTGSGGVTVRLPGSLGAEIEVDTGSGGIELDFPVEVREMSRRHVEGRIGDGGGRIRIDTGSGSVRIVRR